MTVIWNATTPDLDALLDALNATPRDLDAYLDDLRAGNDLDALLDELSATASDLDALMDELAADNYLNRPGFPGGSISMTEDGVHGPSAGLRG